jgi:hypothetical protein
MQKDPIELCLLLLKGLSLEMFRELFSLRR